LTEFSSRNSLIANVKQGAQDRGVLLAVRRHPCDLTGNRRPRHAPFSSRTGRLGHEWTNRKIVSRTPLNRHTRTAAFLRNPERNPPRRLHWAAPNSQRFAFSHLCRKLVGSTAETPGTRHGLCVRVLLLHRCT
jgi:hypothetical protein